MLRSTWHRSVLALVSVFAFAIAAVIPAANAAPRHTFDTGHIDAFNVQANNGELILNLKEDVTGSHVTHAPEDVVLKVKEAAFNDAIPSSIPGSPSGYLLPMTQDPNLIWPGWDTMGVQSDPAGFSQIDIAFTKVAGPGDIHLFSSSMFGVSSLLKDGGYQLKTGSVIDQKYPAHTHANWVFSKPGTYTLTVQASGATKDGTVKKSNTATYTFQVGDNKPEPTPTPDPKPTTPAPEPTATPTPDPSATPDPTPTSPEPKPTDSSPTPAPTTPAPQPTTPAPKPTAPAPKPTVPAPKPTSDSPAPAPSTEQCIPTKVTRTEKGSVKVATEGHFDLGAQLQGGKLMASLKDDRRQPAQWVNPSSIVFKVSDAARTSAPEALSFVASPGSNVWVIGSTQQAGVPWLGQNTMHPSIVNGTTGPVTWTLNGVTGPGKLAVFNSGGLGSGVGQRVFDNVGGPTSYTVPANTHAHPNWVFTAPGIYRVSITQSATTNAGQKVSAATTLLFAVGNADPAAAGTSTTVEEWVGKTPDGKDCELSPEQIAKLPAGAKVGGLNTLPTTGSEGGSELLIVTGALGLAGALTLAARRRFA